MKNDYQDLDYDDAPVCRSCGTSHDLHYGPDPYAMEINDNFDNVWLCAACLRESAADV